VQARVAPMPAEMSTAGFSFKEKTPNGPHTFWDYLHSMIELTEKRLEPIWKKGYMIGFIDKATAEGMLERAPEGTFMIRFSDSTLGGVTIGSRSSPSHSKPVIWHKFKEELSMRGIADVICDLGHLKFVHPNISKRCFEELRLQARPGDEEYVKIDVVARITSDQEETILFNKDILNYSPSTPNPVVQQEHLNTEDFQTLGHILSSSHEAIPEVQKEQQNSISNAQIWQSPLTFNEFKQMQQEEVNYNGPSNTEPQNGKVSPESNQVIVSNPNFEAQGQIVLDVETIDVEQLNNTMVEVVTNMISQAGFLSDMEPMTSPEMMSSPVQGTSIMEL